MTPPKPSDAHSAEPRCCVVREDHIEYGFIGTLQKLKYEYLRDIHDRATLEANFREKFEALNRVRLTDSEFARLLDEITTPDVFTASKTLRSINAFKAHLFGFTGTPIFEQNATSQKFEGCLAASCVEKGLSYHGTQLRIHKYFYEPN